MEMVSTVDAWLELAKISDEDDRLAAWETEDEARFPSIFSVYYSAWGDPAHRHQAAVQAPAMIAAVRNAEDRARRLASRAEADFRARGLLEGQLHTS